MGIKLQGGNNSSNLANVNSLNQLQVVTPQDSAGLSAGFVQISANKSVYGEADTYFQLPPECSDDYRIRSGIDQTAFNASFEGATLLTTQWNQLLTTHTTALVGGFMILNSGVSTASGGASYVRTWRHFPVFGTYPTYCDMWIREGNALAVNAISEWGFLYVTAQATQQPIDGIFFRRVSGGQLKAIITASSIDLVEIALDTANVPARNGIGNYDPTESNHYLISLHNDVARFWINDVMVGETRCPPQQGNMTSSSNLPVGFRVTNIGLTSVGRQISVGYVNVGLADQNSNKPWAHAMVGSNQGAYQLQIGNNPGPTVTRGVGAQGHPTSGTNRITGTWTATSAPALNNLGGLWTSPAMSTLASDADYPIFSFQGSTGTATVAGKTLYVTGVRIGDTSATVGATANAIFLSYIVQVESSAAATSTTDSATTTAGKSITIGGHGFAATDVVGTMKPGFQMTFDPPLVVPQAKYFTVIVRPFGTVTSNTLVVTGSVAVNGYFE